MNAQFWPNKKVLITGHTGFKGSWLSFWLRRMGANVKGIALEPATKPNMFELIIRQEDLQTVYGDIRNLNLLKREIKRYNPEIIIHLAAQSVVQESYQKPIETIETNIIGTANVLEAARTIDSIKAILCVTSDKCYENREWPWKYRENDMMGGYDPYSASKGCSELIISSYKRSFFNSDFYEEHGTAVASARAGNVIGGGDWSKNRLIPDIIRSFSRNNPVIIRNPEAVRPWQHILDVLQGYLLLTERLYEEGPQFAEAWNFGPASDNAKSVRYISDFMAQKWGNGASWKHDNQNNPHEAFTLKLDSSKAHALLGWKPRLSLDQGLEFAINWYEQFYDGNNTRTITDNQISTYEEMCSSVETNLLYEK